MKLDPRFQYLVDRMERRASRRDSIVLALSLDRRFEDRNLPEAVPGEVPFEEVLALEKVPALISFAGDPARFETMGIRIRSHTPELATVDIPYAQLKALRRDPQVRFIEAGQPLAPDLDRSLGWIGAAEVHQGSPPITGEGVVIGIIDTGIDYTHSDFINPDGTTRILFIWDQGLLPQGNETSPAGFGYGVEYARDQINTALTSNNPFSLVRHRDTDSTSGHGTHVAGIAAGNGRATGGGQPPGRYVGVAPDAELIVVRTKSPGTTLGDSTNAVDAYRYIFEKVADRPCVISQSSGMNGGAHDGSTLLEREIDRLLRVPGRAIVKSAGNEQKENIHAAAIVRQDESVSLDLEVPDNDRLADKVEVWYSSLDEVDVSVRTPDGEETGWVAPGERAQLNLANGNEVFLLSELFNENNGDNRIFVQLAVGTQARVSPGGWQLRLRGKQSLSGQIDAWVERDLSRSRQPEQARFSGTHLEPKKTLSIPGTANYVIAVGSFNRTNTTDQVSAFSSNGPTRDERQKPELCAPGEQIASSLSRDAGRAAPEPDGVHHRISGTSMAAPHVAGAVALLFQINPKLTSEQARKILMASAERAPGQTGYDPGRGFGRLNVKRAVEMAAQIRP